MSPDTNRGGTYRAKSRPALATVELHHRKGVDTNDAIEQVVAQLENFLKAKRTKEKTVVKLKELGLKSQTGKLGLYDK